MLTAAQACISKHTYTHFVTLLLFTVRSDQHLLSLHQSIKSCQLLLLLLLLLQPMSNSCAWLQSICHGKRMLPIVLKSPPGFPRKTSQSSLLISCPESHSELQDYVQRWLLDINS